jgi:peroxiredoxin
MPDIHLIAADGRESPLASHLGEDGAVVFFMRAASCPICLAHAATAVRMAEAGELGGARLVVITPGDAKDAAAVAKRVKSPLASVWASGSAHANAGLGSTLLIQHSGTFVLDRLGTVLHAQTSVLPTGNFSAEAVREALGAHVG